MREPVQTPATKELLPNSVRRDIQRTMDQHAGVLRSRASLERATKELMALGTETGAKPCTEDWETTNIHALASVLVHHALLREETRGSHWREDFPDRDDQGWRMRLVSRLGEQGQLETRRIGVDANSGSDHD